MRENFNSRESQTDSTPVDKYQFTLNTKGVRCYPKFQLSREGLYKWPLYMNKEAELSS